MQYKNLLVIGTSHIAKQSLKEVERAIKRFKPDIIALELDKKRLYALMGSKKKRYSIKRVGLKGFLFSLIGSWIENYLGKKVNVTPGSEMKEAIRLAKRYNIKIALIDQDIEITLRRFSEELGWKEKLNFIIDIIKSFVSKDKIEVDLTKVPDKKLINDIIKKVKQRYPSVYKILVEERNQVMANNLHSLMKENPDKRILAVVGAGHKEGLMKLL